MIGRHGAHVWPALESPGMTKWEYMTAPVLVHATKQILDNFGQDGWELCRSCRG